MSLMERLGRVMAERAAGMRFQREDPVFFLGNDREIGQETRSPERRVAITPDHVEELLALFNRTLALDLRVLVLEGAGRRAGCSDHRFIEAGAEIVTLDELPHLDDAPDVVHALKEPSTYEALFPGDGTFCRIGALHSGDFNPGGGLARLLRRGNVAVFDGSHIGAPGSYRTPVRGRMSEFAGWVAAEWILKHLDRSGTAGRVVVVGAGRAGLAAVDKLAGHPRVAEVHLCEEREEQRKRVEELLGKEKKITVRPAGDINHPALLDSLAGAAGILFAVARPSEKAPKVIEVEHLLRLPAAGSITVDISIDEKGAVLDHDVRPSWGHDKLIEHFRGRFFDHGHVYRALANMPRANPRRASREHGAVVLPYLAVLLFLCAEHGGARGALEHVKSLPYSPVHDDPEEVEDARLLEVLTADLRSGLSLHTDAFRRNVEGTVADAASVLSFLDREGLPMSYTFSAETSRREREMDVCAVLPPEVGAALRFALERGVAFSLLSHPGADGTRTEDAARALGVLPAQVLKSLVFRTPEGAYLAAVCPGTEHISEEKLAAAAGEKEVHLASRAEVVEVTGHTVGGVPILALFELPRIPRIFVSRGVLEFGDVYGSAGTEFMGMRFSPSAFTRLGAAVEDLRAERG